MYPCERASARFIAHLTQSIPPAGRKNQGQLKWTEETVGYIMTPLDIEEIVREEGGRGEE